MMIEGHVSNGLRRTMRDEERVCGIAAKIRSLDGECVYARRYPLRSSAPTAIELPGYEDRSHQLGSNPPESNAQLLSLTGLIPRVKFHKKVLAAQARSLQTPQATG